jgi:hypothetical protein
MHNAKPRLHNGVPAAARPAVQARAEAQPQALRMLEPLQEQEVLVVPVAVAARAGR